MLETLKQKQRRQIAKVNPEGNGPRDVKYRDGEFGLATLSNGQSDIGSCLRCSDAPCIEYSADELEVEGFSDFPADLNPGVCPTSAIRWPIDSPAPTVDLETCIQCGLCAHRCPVGAIKLGPQGVIINDAPNAVFLNSSTSAFADEAIAQKNAWKAAPKSGVLRRESGASLANVIRSIETVLPEQNLQFPNHLARNLLIAVVGQSAMRRRGDTNVRMDIIYSDGGNGKGVSEAEFGVEVLEAPRNLLDNVAVLAARYKLDALTITPLAVTLLLPNQRSDFWQVISDIRNALDIRIRTITIGVLIMCVWNRSKLRFDATMAYHLNAELQDLTESVSATLGRTPNVTVEQCPGTLACGK